MDRYEEALERAKKGLPIDEVFPELKESEDERIRKELLEEIEFIIPHDDETDSEGLILPSYHARIDRYKSYLEKQKEQKPSEWSDEDEAMLESIIKDYDYLCKIWLRDYEKRLGGADLAARRDTREQISFLKSLRPQPHWKPSEEQMEALMLAIEGKWDAIKPTGYMSRRLEDLYEGLANTFGVECNLEK